MKKAIVGGCLGVMLLALACTAPTPAPIIVVVTATPEAMTNPSADPQSVLIADAQTHVDAATEYRNAGQLGLTLTELQQALAVMPGYAPAQAMQPQVIAAATTEIQQANAKATADAVAARAQETAQAQAAEAQQTAVIVVARAAATATAQAQIEALRAATTTARSQAEQAYKPTLATYAGTAPQGGWSAIAGGVDVAVSQFRYIEGFRSDPLPPNRRYVRFAIVVVNAGTSTIHVNPFNVTVVDQRGASYPYSTASSTLCATPLQAVDVRPGNHTTGCLAFVVASTTGPAKIIYEVNPFSRTDVVVNIERPPDFVSQ